MAFYLKYRPQKIAELDLKEVRDQLCQALSSKEIPHAFLFTGPRGTGKTSAARIVAKTVNCEKRKVSQGKTSDGGRLKRSVSHDSSEVEELASEPCNQCDSCLSITAGTNLDVLEIDGASNRGIDDIRNLREKIKLSPAQAKYKVYIIDEVHMLTTEAFNALLKTLEEPPPHAIFVLCTTEPQKLPKTIVSRCLRFNYRKAKLDELINGLNKIVKAEMLKVEKGVLEKIAQAADGSFRDSQKLLEQLSFKKGRITGEKVDEFLGQVGETGPEKLLGYLVDKDARAAVLEIGRVVESGVSLRWYSEKLLGLLRSGLLAKLGVEILDKYNTETLKLIERLKIEEIKNLIEIFSRAAVELRTAIIPQLPLEMAVVEWIEKSKIKNKQSLISNENEKLEKVEKVEQVEEENPIFTTHPQPTTHNSPLSSNPNLSFDSICQKWPEVLEAVGPKNHSIRAFLRASRPKEFDGENLTLEVFYEFHKTQLEQDKCRRIIEECAHGVYGVPIKVRCVLGEKPKPEPLPSAKPVGQLGKENSPTYRMSLSSPVETEDDIISVAEEIFGKTAD